MQKKATQDNTIFNFILYYLIGCHKSQKAPLKTNQIQFEGTVITVFKL